MSYEFKELKKDISDFLKSKGIEAYFGNNNITLHQQLYIRFTKLTDNDYQNLYDYFNLFKTEFSKYSNTFIKNIKLKSIIFVTDLRVDNNSSGNFINISTTPDPNSSSLILDIFHKPKNKLYDSQCIHHELFHLIDFNINGGFIYEDKNWTCINDSDFKYGSGGASAYHNTEFKNLQHPIEGFVSEYAMLGVDEDRAETFMYMMTDYLRKDLERWIEDDKKLEKKVEYLSNFIKKLNLDC